MPRILPRLQGACTLIFLLLAVPAGAESARLRDITGPSTDYLKMPSDVVVDDRRVCVVDSGHHRVVCFDQAGKVLFALGQEGSGPGEFASPVGLGMDRQGRLFVADSGNHRIQIVSTSGQPAGSIDLRAAGKSIRPIDVVPDRSKAIMYVTSNLTHEVMAFDQTGNLLLRWGGNGSNRGQFRYPATLVLDKGSRVAVVDVINARVQVFQPNGNFSTQVGEWGVRPGQMFRPKGVTADKAGRFFVSDSYLGVVQSFSSTGQYQDVIKRGEKEMFTTPTGVDVDANGRLYVVEMLANRIAVMKAGNGGG